MCNNVDWEERGQKSLKMCRHPLWMVLNLRSQSFYVLKKDKKYLNILFHYKIVNRKSHVSENLTFFISFLCYREILKEIQKHK